MPRTLQETPRSSQDQPKASEPSDLARRYGSIGIPAVAAAARYCGDNRQEKSPAVSLVARRREDAA